MAGDAAQGAGEKLPTAGLRSDWNGKKQRREVMSKMTLKTEGEKYVVVTRRFAASPEAVYRAHTDAKLVQQWMLGPDGWTMPVCQIDARPGGKIRYEWSDGKGNGSIWQT